ncbi:hypothetical protein P4I59_24900, partial [Escherichia coli]|uniref:hypothetical protein n=1 Tax=Escherichia coli TaxID=562 RepID=UPI003CEB0DE6
MVRQKCSGIRRSYLEADESGFLYSSSAIFPLQNKSTCSREGANKRGNSSRLTQSFHFFMFEPI